MKRRVVFLIIAVTTAIVVDIFVTNKQNDLNLRKKVTATKQTVLSPQTNSEGSITVKVTPKELSQSSSSWDFEVVLDTHTDNLDQDLTKNSVLVDDKGNRLTPISWEGDPPGGHHRAGVLKFNPIPPATKSIELTISKIGNSDKKVFRWNLI